MNVRSPYIEPVTNVTKKEEKEQPVGHTIILNKIKSRDNQQQIGRSLSSSTQNCVSLSEQSHQNTSFDNQGAHAGSAYNVLSPEIQREAANYLMQLKIQPSRLARLGSNESFSVPENIKIESNSTNSLTANQLRAPYQGKKIYWIIILIPEIYQIIVMRYTLILSFDFSNSCRCQSR